MEDRILKRHIDELNAGHIIVAIQSQPDRVDEAVMSHRKMAPVALCISASGKSPGTQSKPATTRA